MLEIFLITRETTGWALRQLSGIRVIYKRIVSSGVGRSKRIAEALSEMYPESASSSSSSPPSSSSWSHVTTRRGCERWELAGDLYFVKWFLEGLENSVIWRVSSHWILFQQIFPAWSAMTNVKRHGRHQNVETDVSQIIKIISRVGLKGQQKRFAHAPPSLYIMYNSVTVRPQKLHLCPSYCGKIIHGHFKSMKGFVVLHICCKTRQVRPRILRSD